MSGISAKRHIAAPPSVVYEQITDLRNAASRISKIESVEVLTDGPIRVGTRWRETRIMFNRPCTEEMEITVLEPDSRMATVAESHGSVYHSEFRLRPADGGTEVEFVFRAQPRTLLAKVSGALLMPLMKKTLIRQCTGDLDDLKAACEAARPASSSG